MPGAVEMYYGFMKMGLSIMFIFFGAIALTAFFESGVLSFTIVISWFYGFFHARNFAAMTEEELLNIPDEPVIDVNRFLLSDENSNLSSDIFKRKIVQYGILFVGITLVWQGLMHVIHSILQNYDLFYRFYGMLDSIPRLVLGIAIVWFGCYIIQVKKEEIAKAEESIASCSFENSAETNAENNAETKIENIIDAKVQSEKTGDVSSTE